MARPAAWIASVANDPKRRYGMIVPRGEHAIFHFALRAVLRLMASGGRFMEKRALYVQYGCGFSPGEGWENFDSSPTLRVERMPIIGPFLSAKLSGNARPFPSSVRYGDICKGLPI